MKFEVELKRESHVTYTVEADSPEEAEDKAWEQLATDAYKDADASWRLESVVWVEEE